jgi:hypothetical protein
MRKLFDRMAFAALAGPAAAAAGGWATAGVGPPPEDVRAGETWNAKMTILQHGNPETPLMGVIPTLTIRNGSTTKTFKGTMTDESGVSVAKVVFPSAGKWSYAVYDGFTGTAARRRTPSRRSRSARPVTAAASDDDETTALAALMGTALGFPAGAADSPRAPAPTTNTTAVLGPPSHL